MATGKKEKEGQREPVKGTLPVEPIAETTISVEPSEGTMPPEAQLEPLSQEEIDARIAEAKERGKADAWEEYQGIQRVVAQKDQKIVELERQVAQASKTVEDDLVEILLQERKGKASEYGEEDTLIPKLEGILAKRKEAQKQTQLQAYYSKADAIYKKAEEAYSEDDVDSLHAIRTLIRAGDFDLAEKKIAKASKREEKKEAEAKTDTSPFVSEEAKRKWMEEHGLLESETPSPSGGSRRFFTREQIAGMSIDEYTKLQAEINKAWEEGRIK